MRAHPGLHRGDTQPITGQAQAADEGLHRALGVSDLAALTINGTIGAGILGLPGKLYGLVGAYSLLICAAAAVLTAMIALSLAQISSRFARTGGAYLFLRTAFGPRAGFAAGWLSLITSLLSYATIANLVVTYSAAALPGIDHGWPRLAAFAALNLGLGTLVFRGVRLSARVHLAFSVLKFGLLSGFILLCLPRMLSMTPHLGPLPDLGAVAPALVLMMFALCGMEATVIQAGEMRDPARDVPRALGLAIGSVAVIYGLVLLAAMASVPDLGHSARPVFDGAVALGGPLAGGAVLAGGVISMTGVLFVILFSGPRVMFALSSHGDFPSALAMLHPRFATPSRAIVLHGLVAFGLAAGSSFLSALQAATLTRLLLYAAIGAATIVLARRGYSQTRSPLILPGGQLIAAGATILSLALVAQSTRQEMISVVVCLLPGAVLAAAKRRQV